MNEPLFDLVPAPMRQFTIAHCIDRPTGEVGEKAISLLDDQRVRVIVECEGVRAALFVKHDGDAYVRVRLFGGPEQLSKPFDAGVEHQRATEELAQRCQAEFRCLWDDLRQEVEAVGWQLGLINENGQYELTSIWKISWGLDQWTDAAYSACSRIMGVINQCRGEYWQYLHRY